MKNHITTHIIAIGIMGGISAVSAFAGNTLTFGGISLPAISVESASTDLHSVYVIDNQAGAATVSYTADASGNTVEVQRFGADGIAYASTVNNVSRDGSVYTWAAGAEDTGFIVNDGGRLHAWWVVNYDRHRLDLQGVSVNTEMSACDRTALTAAGSGDAILYYSTTSRPLHLSRDITAEYRSLAWDESSEAYTQTTITKSFEALSSAMYIDAPLCDTEVTLSGDRFLRALTGRYPVIRFAALSDDSTVNEQQINASENWVSSMGV